MAQLVRVKDQKSGHEFTTTETFAKSAGLEVVKGKEAVGSDGRALPPTYTATSAKAAKAEAPKES